MSNGNDENLTLSDWITFLSGESNAGIPNILNLGAFALVFWAGISGGVVTATTNGDIRTPVIALSGIILVIVVWIATTKFQHDANKAKKLLRRIMKGELKDPLVIQREWKGEK